MAGRRRVAIVGAGVAGLATARLLLAEGHRCTLFERRSVLGGVWAVGYSNFGVQVQKELYEFPDHPLPEDVPDFTPGERLRSYLEDYARRFEVWPHIRLGASVEAIREASGGGRGWTVHYEQAGARRQQGFDFVVVCVGLYSDVPRVPAFPGRERFGGDVIHVSGLKTRSRLRGRKVVVVGYGKSATDAALESAAVASETAIVFREPHWPVPPKLAGVLPFKWAMLNRLTSALLPLYYRPSGVERILHAVGRPLVWLWWRLVERLLIAQCGLGSRFGTRASLVPRAPVEIDAFGESTMLPRSRFYRLLRNGGIRPHRSAVRGYTATGVVLESGECLAADVVVLATGWETRYDLLGERTRSALGLGEDGLYLYRQMVHPDLPDLAFVGNASTIASILTYSLQARWLADLLGGRHELPPRESMLREIEELKAWKRSWMPFSSARAARLLLHMQHYHDQLVADLGACPLRKRGIFAPFKEVFAPYQPSDYAAVVSGAWRGEAAAR